MRETRFTEADIIGVLKMAEADRRIAEPSRSHGISAQTYHRWKAKLGGLKMSALTRTGSSVWTTHAHRSKHGGVITTRTGRTVCWATGRRKRMRARALDCCRL